MFVVQCNVLDVWEFGPLGLCVSPGTNGPQTTCMIWFRSKNPFGTDPVNGALRPAPRGRMDSGFENQPRMG